MLEKKHDVTFEDRKMREMCGVLLKHRKRAKNWMLMQGLNDTIDQLAVENSVCHCCGHMLRREDSHVLRRA